MNDDDIEQLLRRYEPADAPPSLRARVVRAFVPSPGRGWAWAIATAALLAMTVWLHGATARTIDRHAAPSSETRSEHLLSDMMGGDDDARLIARKIAAIEEEARRSPVPVATSGVNGDAQ